MKVIDVSCPNCGAKLSFNGSVAPGFGYCEYCDTRVRLEEKAVQTARSNINSQNREAELNYQLKLREAEINAANNAYEKAVKFNRDFFKKRIFYYIAGTIVGFVLGFYDISNFNALSILGIITASMCLVALTYGSIGHAIALAVKRKRFFK